MLRLSEQLEIVNRFRQTAPVDVESLALALGVKVERAFLDADLSGMIERAADSSTYKITINFSDPETRQRFTIAHELGHYLLHRHLIGTGIADDRAYRSTASGKYHNVLIGPRQETEANRFAADVLMPFDLVKRLEQEEGLRTPAQLAQRLRVSTHAMSIRMGVPYRAA